MDKRKVIYYTDELNDEFSTAVITPRKIDGDYIYDRQSRNEARKKNEIGISSIRGGNIVGDHDAMFISDEEILTVSHRAMTRDVFAKGALTAAKFMCCKDAGSYTMSDVIADAIKE